MRFLTSVLLLSTALAQSGPRVQLSHTTESLRGVSVVSRQVAWASGTHGTYLRTIDSGITWTPTQVPGAEALDFRGVVAFSADEAFLMSSGLGDQARIYHTADAGKSWQLQFTSPNPKGFFDSIAFWDPKHGVVVGDPLPDNSGKLTFEVLLTDDGQNWHAVPSSALPVAIQGEGSFAASNTCIAILNSPAEVVAPASSPAVAEASRLRSDVWFATGGPVARVLHSPDRGHTWEVFDTPIWHGRDSTGIFSIAFRDPLHGVIAGGDYKHPNDDGDNLAFTDDGGKHWTLSPLHPQAFFSSVVYDRSVNAAALRQQAEEQAAEAKGKKVRVKPVAPQRLFIVGQDFIFDFRPPSNPERISAKKSWGMQFNAASPYPEGGALIVGPKGSIAYLP